MNRSTAIFATILGLFLWSEYSGWACTSVLVSRGASKKGVPLISYSCDGEFHPLIRIIPPADYPAGEMAEIRGWRKVLGKIPQVAHTYKVVGLMNEHQLALGETTFGGREELINPDGMFQYFPLMLITLQRAKTAREAVRVMTGLVEEYGYGSEGESISIADKEEAWLLEIVGTGPGGKGAIWVALRIPEGLVCATANMSRIRTFPLGDPENCLYEPRVIDFAVQKGYFNPKSGKPFDFSRAYNPPTEEQVRYSARRIWSIFRRIAPSQKFSPEYSDGQGRGKAYPLWVKPDQKLDVRDVINLHRDHYEGTEFDMTRDEAAGSFGSPDRWRPMKWEVNGKKYVWERPIATQQVGFVYVAEPCPWLPETMGGIVWYGVDNPFTNFFIPFYTSITRLPESFTRGSLAGYTRDSAWWTVNFVANFANLRYDSMIKDIQALQSEIEDMYFGSQDAVEAAAIQLLKTRGPGFAIDFLTRYCVDHAEMNVTRWQQLGDFLITKYNDGYIQDDNHRPREVGYRESWLRKEVKQSGKRRQITSEKTIDREL
jgi:dipeptidase